MSVQRPLRLALTGLAASATLVALLPQAHASGFAVARFGGHRGTPVSINPTGLYYNPGALGLTEGFQAMVDYNLAWRTASYDRPISAIGRPSDSPSDFSAEYLAANSGEGTLDNIVGSPAIALSYHFGENLPLAIGAGFYVPFGGSAVWDTREATPGFPGSSDGPQRWYTIDGTIRTLGISLGAAYYIEPARLSLGISGNYYSSSINTIRARIASGYDDMESGGEIVEGRSIIDASSTDFGVGVGAMWEAIPDQLWIGASWQSRPGFSGEMAMEGTLENFFPPNQDDNDIVITQSLPDIFRLGASWKPTAKWELRLFGDYTRWSVLQQQCVIETARLGDTDPFEFCATQANGSLEDRGNSVVLNLGRNWEDAFGVRAGTSYFLNDRVEFFLDVGFDGNAIPDETLEPALFDMNKYSIGAGGVVEVLNGVSLSLGVTNIFYAERDTTGTRTANYLLPPSTQPSSEGVYNQNILVVNTGLWLQF